MFECNICHKIFEKSTQLRGHLSGHKRSKKKVLLTEERNLCPVCQKNFIPKSRDQIYCSITCFREKQQKNRVKFGVEKRILEKYKFFQRKCEICGKDLSFQTLEQDLFSQGKKTIKRYEGCLDHNHQTNLFRGILCQSCNRNLGWYEERKKYIEAYLEKNNDFRAVQEKIIQSSPMVEAADC